MTWHTRAGVAKACAQALVSNTTIYARLNWHVVRFYLYNEMYCIALVFRRGKNPVSFPLVSLFLNTFDKNRSHAVKKTGKAHSAIRTGSRMRCFWAPLGPKYIISRTASAKGLSIKFLVVSGSPKPLKIAKIPYMKEIN